MTLSLASIFGNATGYRVPSARTIKLLCSDGSYEDGKKLKTRVSELLAAFVIMISWAPASHALPGFAQQTGQVCSKCHVGSYGPQLKEYGRDFKLFGYASGDDQNHLPPISLVALSSYTETKKDRAAPLPNYKVNDNFASIDKFKLAYAGEIAYGIGTFSEVTYDGVKSMIAVDNVDVRKAFNPTIGGKDVVLGIDLNNRPTAQDLWNSTPTFEFLPNSNPFGPLPSASSIVDAKLAQRVVGLGGYTMINNTIYAEATVYNPLNNSMLKRLGIQNTPTTDTYDGLLPYWRIALQHNYADRHYLQLGAYGMLAKRFPNANQTRGTDDIEDVAGDLNYQYTASEVHFLSAHATYIREHDQLNASKALAKSNNLSDHFDTSRFDVSYSYKDKWIPSVGVFKVRGSSDKGFFKTPSGSPDSTGYIAEIAYAQWGTTSAPVNWANIRYSLRYVGYSMFNGNKVGATGNNTLYLSVRIAMAPFGAGVSR